MSLKKNYSRAANPNKPATLLNRDVLSAGRTHNSEFYKLVLFLFLGKKLPENY
jgi:hypothetical protein